MGMGGPRIEWRDNSVWEGCTNGDRRQEFRSACWIVVVAGDHTRGKKGGQADAKTRAR